MKTDRSDPGSIASQKPVHQLLNGWYETIVIEWILGEHESVAAGKHKIFFDVAAVRDFLECFLNAEGSWIGQFASCTFFVRGPITEAA